MRTYLSREVNVPTGSDHFDVMSFAFVRFC
jgi:hypothetical protein